MVPSVKACPSLRHPCRSDPEKSARMPEAESGIMGVIMGAEANEAVAEAPIFALSQARVRERMESSTCRCAAADRRWAGSAAGTGVNLVPSITP